MLLTVKSLNGYVIRETVCENKLQDNICKQYEQSDIFSIGIALKKSNHVK